MFVLPQRASCNQRSAILVQHMKAPEQAQENTSPWKMNVTIKSPVGDISVVTLIRTDTTLDHSQKAEKVWVLRFWEMTGDIDTYKCRANTCPFVISFDWKRPSLTSLLYENGLPWPILTSVLTANGFSVTNFDWKRHSVSCLAELHSTIRHSQFCFNQTYGDDVNYLSCWSRSSPKIDTITLMRPSHGNL